MTDFDDLFDSAMDDLLGKDSLTPKTNADNKEDSKKQKEEEPPILQYRKVKKVPYLKRWPRCGLCKERLLGNRYGWFTECEDGEHWWWCVRCLEAENCFPTEEEKLRAEQEAANE